MDNNVPSAKSMEKCEVFVKTHWGSLCDKFNVENVEMQGGVLAPLRCSVQIDSLGKDYMSDLERSSNLYRYMNCITIPPMAMIDDVITITECGLNSLTINAAVESKINSKRLVLSQEKCVNMHFGVKRRVCPSLKVHGSVIKHS